LNGVRAEHILACARNRYTARQAARATGLHPVTLERWIRRGQAEEERLLAIHGDVLFDMVDEWLSEHEAEEPITRWQAAAPNWADPVEFQFYVFMSQFRRFSARAVVDAVAAIRMAGNRGSWRATAWLLERMHPDEYGLPMPGPH
jgi:hypothetical protein